MLVGVCATGRKKPPCCPAVHQRMDAHANAAGGRLMDTAAGICAQAWRWLREFVSDIFDDIDAKLHNDHRSWWDED